MGYEAADVGGGDWAVGDPRDARLDARRLDALRDALAARGTTGLLVARRGTIVYEWYGAEGGAAQPHYTASLAKALVGGLALMVALSDGILEPDESVARYIPAWQVSPYRPRITIRHLASHTSGLPDSVTSGVEHEAQPGWKGRFWRGRSDPAINPIAVALNEAPLLCEPGTHYIYSNPGMAVLDYALTAALQGTPHPDIRSLLRERIMRPLGIADASWAISYGRTYETDDLPVCATWGGGSYTARAIARVGQLLLQDGIWEGQSLIASRWVRAALTYSGTAIPRRTACNPEPASGLCWYLNSDGVWPLLPRDAFAGAGAGHQVLLAIPSRDLLVVRQGSALSEDADCFWGDLEQQLFVPLLDAFLERLPEDQARAPYPPSPVIREIAFDPPSTVIRRGFHSDNWPITWADDDVLYTAYGDGWGFRPHVEEVLSLGFCRVSGPPDNFHGTNLRTSTGEQQGPGGRGLKASGMLSVAGVLYLWARNSGNARLAWSADHGATWSWADWTLDVSFGHPGFINFGRDYAGARDGFVYVYSHDCDNAYGAADHMVMARVPHNALRKREAYRFFVGFGSGGDAEWSADVHDRGAVFEFPGFCRRSQMTYCAPLERYLWWQQYAEAGVDTRFCGGFGIYDAPEPWGPWTTAYFTIEWDTGPGELGGFPTKWMRPDGREAYLVSSSFDCFAVRKATFALR